MADNDFLRISSKTLDSIRKQKEGLELISDKRLSAWVKYGERNAAEDFAGYVRLHKLQGNPLKWQTGETARSVKPMTPKSGGFRGKIIVRPGAGIDGCLNYLNKWVGTKLEFMAPAAEEYSRLGRVNEYVKGNLDKMLDKVAKEMSSDA